jgi:HlyD family secretion protein
VQVELGRMSVSTVEIVKGLQAGDKVILSDTSAQDGYKKIRLN